jgi:hypothetical protein
MIYKVLPSLNKLYKTSIARSGVGYAPASRSSKVAIDDPLQHRYDLVNTLRKSILGMSVSFIRSFVCWAMVLMVPQSLPGQTPAAILHAQGGVWINGYEAKDSAAVFAGDLLETRPGFSANLTLEGSAVLIQAESVSKFQGDWLELDHGAVSVETSKSFQVRVNCIKVVPVANEWTQYEVTNVNGTVQVAAHKSDVNVQVEDAHRKPSGEMAGSQGGSVHEGEQRNYDESQLCGAPPRPTGARSALNPKWIAIGAGGTGLLIWILVHGGGGSSPVISPWQP